MSVSTQMLPDDTKSEGVGPDPPLGWSDKADLKDQVVHGSAFSQATTMLRAYFVFAGATYKHEQHRKAKSQGIKLGSNYQKVPFIEVTGRQVNDSWIILQNLHGACLGD